MWFLLKIRVEMGVYSWNFMGVAFVIYLSMCISFLLKESSFRETIINLMRNFLCPNAVSALVPLPVNPGRSCCTLKVPRSSWLALRTQHGFKQSRDCPRFCWNSQQGWSQSPCQDFSVSCWISSTLSQRVFKKTGHVSSLNYWQAFDYLYKLTLRAVKASEGTNKLTFCIKWDWVHSLCVFPFWLHCVAFLI